MDRETLGFFSAGSPLRPAGRDEVTADQGEGNLHATEGESHPETSFMDSPLERRTRCDRPKAIKKNAASR